MRRAIELQGCPVSATDFGAIIITGGAGSIGRAIAAEWLERGGSVFLVDRDADGLATVRASLACPDRTATQCADVTDSGQMADAIARAVDRFGPLQGIVSNAGIIGPIAPIAEYAEDAFDEVVRVHLKGAFLACKHGLAQVVDGGSIVIVSSVAGLRGDPGPYGYIAAKHAQVGLMRAVAKEAAARSIRVNTIHPGPVANEFQAEVEQRLTPLVGQEAGAFFDQMIPLGRHAHPQEIAAATCFLLGPDASFVTGATLSVDGGMSA